jgi:tetratricopeptide (TPR) repeat protein
VRAALAYLEDAAAVLRTVEDPPTLSLVLGNLAVLLPPAETARAQACSAEALALAQAVGEPFRLGYVTMAAANAVLQHGGDLAVARAYVETALRVARTLGADRLERWALSLLGRVAGEQGRAAEAVGLLEAALVLGERLGDRRLVAAICSHLAWWASDAGAVPRAAALYQRALTLTRDIGGSRPLLASCLAGIARLLSAGDQAVVAVQLLAATDTDADWWGTLGTAYTSVLPYRWFPADHTAALAAAQMALSADAFAQAWAEGQALTPEAAVELALAAAGALVHGDLGVLDAQREASTAGDH